MRSRIKTRWPWVALIVLAIVRQWVFYGPWAALILAVCLTLFVIPVRRLVARGKRPGLVLDLLALISAFAAIIAISSAPFAETPNHGTGVSTSRHTNVGAAILAAAMALGFWLWARWAVRRSASRGHTES